MPGESISSPGSSGNVFPDLSSSSNSNFIPPRTTDYESLNELNNPFGHSSSNYNSFPNQNEGFKGQMIGSAITVGGSLLEGLVTSISSLVNKSKDIEILKIKLEKEKFLQKEKEKKELMKRLKIELKKKEDNFYENQITKFEYVENFDKEEIINLYNQNMIKNDFNTIKTNSDFLKQIDAEILDVMSKSRLDLKKSETLNIYITGITGVGKTCLKNVICEKLYSVESFGERGTNRREKFKCECHNYLSFTDNIGFELGGQYSLQNLVLDTKNYIMEKVKSNNEAIHCIWYCITGTRLQDEEYKVICDLRKIYKENNIPFIIVYTQGIETEKIKNMKKYINEKLKLENNEEIGEKPENIQFIPLLAKKTEVNIGQREISIKPYNISKLIKNTYNGYKYSMDLINKKCLIELIKEKINKKYENKLLSCFEIINNYNNITEDNFDNLIYVLSKELISNNKTENQILELNFIKNKILSYISQKYENFKKEKEKKLMIDIMTIQRDFCINNSNEDINLGSLIKSENEIKAEISFKIDSKNIKEYKIFYLNKISKIFFNYFVQELKNKILELYLCEIESDKIKNEIYDSSKIENNKINEDIRNLINELKIKEN